MGRALRSPLCRASPRALRSRPFGRRSLASPLRCALRLPRQHKTCADFTNLKTRVFLHHTARFRLAPVLRVSRVSRHRGSARRLCARHGAQSSAPRWPHHWLLSSLDTLPRARCVVCAPCGASFVGVCHVQFLLVVAFGLVGFGFMFLCGVASRSRRCARRFALRAPARCARCRFARARLSGVCLVGRVRWFAPVRALAGAALARSRAPAGTLFAARKKHLVLSDHHTQAAPACAKQTAHTLRESAPVAYGKIRATLKLARNLTG